jgi:hypothetical protein
MHPKKITAMDELSRASAHLISLFLNDLLTQSLIPKMPPSSSAPAKELTALQICLISLENMLTNLTKATTVSVELGAVHISEFRKEWKGGDEEKGKR